MTTHQITTNREMDVSFLDETSGKPLSVEGHITVTYTWEYDDLDDDFNTPCQLNYWIAHKPFSVIDLQTNEETLVEAVDLTENQLKEIRCLIEQCLD